MRVIHICLWWLWASCSTFLMLPFCPCPREEKPSGSAVGRALLSCAVHQKVECELGSRLVHTGSGVCGQWIGSVS